MRKKRRNDALSGVTLALVAGALLFCGWGLAEVRRVEKAYTPTNLSRVPGDLAPADTVRLHVIGNSDSRQDQSVKLAVRDALMESFGPRLSAVEDAGDAEKAISSCLSEIETVATSCLKANGMKYSAKAALKTVYFPDRTYEAAGGQDVFLPEGDYKALQIVLGEGRGKNWWCVMYPPLCYFDLVQKAVLSGKAPVTEQRTWVPAWAGDDGRLILVDEESTEELPVEIHFLLIDAVKAGLGRLASLFKVQGQQAARPLQNLR